MVSYTLQVLGMFSLLLWQGGGSVSKCLGISGISFLYVYIFIKSLFVTGSHSAFNLSPISAAFDLTEIIISLSGDSMLLVSVFLIRKADIAGWFSRLYRGKNRFVTGAVSTFLVAWMIVMKVMSVKKTGPDESYERLSLMTILVFVCGTLLLMLIMIVYYRNLRKNEIIEMQESMLMQQQVYISTLEHLQLDIRKLQHDYKNILTSLYVSDENENRTQIFLNQKIREFENRLGSSIQETTSLGRIRIEEVKRLILAKIIDARGKEIQFHMEAFQEIENVFMDIVDFVRCLGILLDNGIEAALRSEEKRVWLVMIQEKCKFTLIVKNTYGGGVQLKDIWQSGYSTKGERRGLGLCNYQEIVSRYSNAVKETRIEKDAFVQILKISSAKGDLHALNEEAEL